MGFFYKYMYLFRSKRLRRKRRRSLTWDRSDIADSCKEAMRRVRAYLHTQRHMPLPSYVVPISDVHSFFGLMYMNILNFGDLQLVAKFFDHFATSRVTICTYDQPVDGSRPADRAKVVPKVKGGDLIAFYFAYFFGTSPDIVGKLVHCNIDPVDNSLNHHHNSTATSSNNANTNTMNINTAVNNNNHVPFQSSSPSSKSSPKKKNVPHPHVNNNSNIQTTNTLDQNSSVHLSNNCNENTNTDQKEAGIVTALAANNTASSASSFALNEYICCVELLTAFQGTRVFEVDQHDLKTIVERDNPLTAPHQRAIWTQARIEEYFAEHLQPLSAPMPYAFECKIRLYINCRRKVDRIEIVRHIDGGWL